MKELLFILILWSWQAEIVCGQTINYVNNGSFEQCVNCTTAPYDIRPMYWESIDSTSYAYLYCGLDQPNSNLPGLEGGYQNPRTGRSMIISTQFCDTATCDFYVSRGYPRNRLKGKLRAGVTYCAKCYLNNQDFSTVAIDAIGMYFGGTELDSISYCSLPLTYLSPQVENASGNFISDTLGFVAITGTFVANGSEKYLVLGNFKENSATTTISANPALLPTIASDIFFDDVSVIELELSAFAGHDTTILPGDSIYLGRISDVGIDEACIWYKLPGASPIDTIAGFWVKPSQTCRYAVRQEICGLIKWDTVSVNVDGVGLVEYDLGLESILVYPNPTNSDVRIKIVGIVNKTINVRVRDLLGRCFIVPVEKLSPCDFIIKTENLANGSYILEIDDNAFTKRFTVLR